ncbi:MAG: hypothetical protein QW423_00550 [Candidatus Aenigmatarchaeota archaeon]
MKNKISKIEENIIMRLYEIGLTTTKISKITGLRLPTSYDKRGKKRLKVFNILNDARIEEKYGSISQNVLDEYDLLNKELNLVGMHIPNILAAITYNILIKKGEPITFDDIAEFFKTNKKSVVRTYKKIYSSIGELYFPDTTTYIRNGIKKLGLSDEIEKNALKFFEENKYTLKGFKPHVVAAACIYTQAKKIKLEKEITYHLGITHQTLRKVMRKLEKNKLSSSQNQ